MIGDLAAQTRSNKVVIFEGGGNSDFDITLVKALFPELNGKFIPISGENKIKVGELFNLLKNAENKKALPYKFYSVADRDSDGPPDAVENQYQWDRYHIENYLLEPQYIIAAIRSLSVLKPIDVCTEAAIDEFLTSCARESMGPLLVHMIRNEINHKMVTCLDFGVDPNASDLGEQFHKRIIQSHDKIQDVVHGELSKEFIQNTVQTRKNELLGCLDDGTWINTFRGRDVLRAVARKLNSQHKLPVKYDQLINLVVSQMSENEFRPEGMRRILMRIVED